MTRSAASPDRTAPGDRPISHGRGHPVARTRQSHQGNRRVIRIAASPDCRATPGPSTTETALMVTPSAAPRSRFIREVRA